MENGKRQQQGKRQPVPAIALRWTALSLTVYQLAQQRHMKASGWNDQPQDEFHAQRRERIGNGVDLSQALI